MEIDKKTIKVLAAESRLEILKSLRSRRKTPSELSKELNLAASTISEHLNKLEDVGLVEREETGHKWVYYSLTRKGSSLVKPKFPTQFVLVLSLGFMFIIGGFVRYFYQPIGFAAEAARPVMTAAGEAAEAVTPVQPDWLMIGLFVVGVILIIVSLIIRLKKK